MEVGKSAGTGIDTSNGVEIEDGMALAILANEIVLANTTI